MSARRSSLVLITVAVVLVAVAAVVRFVVAPNATRLPEDTDQTVHYAGETAMLDSEALRSGDTADALGPGIPVTADRRVRVTSVHGDTAVLEDVMTVRIGEQSLPSAKTYAVDRESREGTAPPASTSTSAEPSRGALNSAFPPDAARDDSYTYYDATTRSIVPVRYTGSAEREGRTVNVYEIGIDAPVKDPAVLEPLPEALPKKLVAGLVPALDATARDRLTPEALAALPDPVPLTYQGVSTLVAHIDRQTGIAIDQKVNREIVATATVAGEPTPLVPVSTLTLDVTPESSKDLGDTAASAGLLLTVLTDATPLALSVVAAVLLAVALLRMRGKRPDTPARDGTVTGASSAQPS
ncbi:porin PorA family protein [Streptomyces sp. NPDC029526]|uniref:porin PorA family protein n=1 Tax=Streptomyces sp. NPDC029526 TaxID=3155728 RepID=UPI0034099152